MKFKKVVFLFTVGLLVFSGVGCKKKNASNDAEKKEFNVVDYSLASEKVVEGAPNIYLIVKAIDNSYFKVMFEAARHASAEYNCNVYYSGSEKSSEWEAQAALMDFAKERGADAVVIAPDDSNKLVDKVTELYNAGISVICVDSVVNTDNYNLAYMTNNSAAGESAAIEMLKQMKSKGFKENENLKVAIQTGRSGSKSTNDRIAGFKDYWAKNASPKWEILSEIKENGSDATKALANTEEIFKNNANIKGLFGLNNASTSSFAKYLLSNTLKDVVLVGFDYSVEAEILIMDSTYSASAVLQRQYDMAFKAIGTAIDIKNGKFSSDKKIVDTGVTVVNNANVNNPEIFIEIGRSN